jgi:torulene dioxygenase
VLSISGLHVGEIPTMESAYKCKKHGYVYSLAQRGSSTLGDTIVKTNQLTQEALMWDTPHGHSPGKVVLVAPPQPKSGEPLAKDDRVLLSMVLDGH